METTKTCTYTIIVVTVCRLQTQVGELLVSFSRPCLHDFIFFCSTSRDGSLVAERYICTVTGDESLHSRLTGDRYPLLYSVLYFLEVYLILLFKSLNHTCIFRNVEVLNFFVKVTIFSSLVEGNPPPHHHPSPLGPPEDRRQRTRPTTLVSAQVKPPYEVRRVVLYTRKGIHNTKFFRMGKEESFS